MRIKDYIIVGIIGLILVMSMTMVSAQEIQIGQISGEIPIKDLQMGDLNKPSIWGNMRLQLFSFVDTSGSQAVSSGDFRLIGSHGAFGSITNGRNPDGNSATAGARCNEGEYIRLFELVRLTGTTLFAHKRDLFDNIYLKKSSTDNIIFTEYWLKDFSGFYGYQCLERIRGADTFHYEYYCRDGVVSSSDDLAGNFNCESGHCRSSGITTNAKQSRTNLETQLCVPPSQVLTCYICGSDGRTFTTTALFQCPVLWSTTKPTCQQTPQMITCYSCGTQGNVLTGTYQEKCPVGWDTKQPTCQTNQPVLCYSCDGVIPLSDTFQNACPSGWSDKALDCGRAVECYTCVDGNLKSELFTNSCPSTMMTERPRTCDERDMVTCYSCNRGVITASAFSEQCPKGWVDDSKEALCKTPFREFLDKMFDFEEKPLQSVAVIVGIALVLIMITAIIVGAGRRGQSGDF